jgi:hypothetical protein
MGSSWISDVCEDKPPPSFEKQMTDQVVPVARLLKAVEQNPHGYVLPIKFSKINHAMHHPIPLIPLGDFPS